MPGTTDALDPRGERLGFERLQAALQASAGAPAHAIGEQLRRDVTPFHAVTPHHDDSTPVALCALGHVD